MNNKLTERCVLIAVTISLPTKNKQDKKITNEVIQRHNAGANAGRWVKSLYPSDITAEAERIGGELRRVVHARSLPWVQDGQRLLPCAAMLDLQQDINDLTAKFSAAADAAAAKFDGEIAQAMVRDNGLFRRDVYPVDAAAFRRSFGVQVKFLPVPDTSHVILEMAQEDIEMIRQSTSQQIADAVSEARADLIRRMSEPVAAMVERLSNPDATFRDTLVENVRSIAALIPALNLSQDATLDSLGGELHALAQHSPDVLRTSKHTRKSVADKAAEVLAKLQKA